MDDDNMLEICREHRVPYSYIRRTFVIEALAEDVKEEIARYETLKCVLWSVAVGREGGVVVVGVHRCPALGTWWIL